jgi:hypothetical protein
MLNTKNQQRECDTTKSLLLSLSGKALFPQGLFLPFSITSHSRSTATTQGLTGSHELGPNYLKGDLHVLDTDRGNAGGRQTFSPVKIHTPRVKTRELPFK